MSLDAGFQGRPLRQRFLVRLRYRDWDWRALDDAALDDLEAALRTIFDDFPIGGSPNESQTKTI